MSEAYYHIVDDRSDEVIGYMVVDEDDLLEAEAQAGALGYYLEEVGRVSQA
jgi:hypothetical protein